MESQPKSLGPDTSAPTPAPRRAYQPPQVIVHGDIRTITEKIGDTPDQDGGGSFTLPALG